MCWQVFSNLLPLSILLNSALTAFGFELKTNIQHYKTLRLGEICEQNLVLLKWPGFNSFSKELKKREWNAKLSFSCVTFNCLHRKKEKDWNEIYKMVIIICGKWLCGWLFSLYFPVFSCMRCNCFVYKTKIPTPPPTKCTAISESAKSTSAWFKNVYITRQW